MHSHNPMRRPIAKPRDGPFLPLVACPGHYPTLTHRQPLVAPVFAPGSIPSVVTGAPARYPMVAAGGIRKGAIARPREGPWGDRAVWIGRRPPQKSPPELGPGQNLGPTPRHTRATNTAATEKPTNTPSTNASPVISDPLPTHVGLLPCRYTDQAPSARPVPILPVPQPYAR